MDFKLVESRKEQWREAYPELCQAVLHHQETACLVKHGRP